MKIVAKGFFSGMMLPVVGIGGAIVGFPLLLLGHTTWYDRSYRYFGAHWDAYVQWARDRSVPDPGFLMIGAVFYTYVCVWVGVAYFIRPIIAS